MERQIFNLYSQSNAVDCIPRFMLILVFLTLMWMSEGKLQERKEIYEIYKYAKTLQDIYWKLTISYSDL